MIIHWVNEYDIREICLMNELRDSRNICAKHTHMAGTCLIEEVHWLDWFPNPFLARKKNVLELEK